MRRKARALLRWSQRNEIEPEKAAKAFIRIFNKKLLDDPNDNELTWSCWFFSVISTTKSLHEIDNYAQEQIRYIISERRNKKRFRVKYGDMKQLGYRNLVHEYYAYDKNSPKWLQPEVRGPAIYEMIQTKKDSAKNAESFLFK